MENCLGFQSLICLYRQSQEWLESHFSLELLETMMQGLGGANTELPCLVGTHPPESPAGFRPCGSPPPPPLPAPPPPPRQSSVRQGTQLRQRLGQACSIPVLKGPARFLRLLLLLPWYQRDFVRSMENLVLGRFGRHP